MKGGEKSERDFFVISRVEERGRRALRPFLSLLSPEREKKAGTMRKVFFPPFIFVSISFHYFEVPHRGEKGEERRSGIKVID